MSFFKKGKLRLKELFLDAGGSIKVTQGFWRDCPLFAKPGDLIQYDDDFIKYNDEEWTVTSENSSATAHASSHGGAITLTTGTTDNNAHAQNLGDTSLTPFIDIQAGKKAWFQCKVTETAPVTALKAGWSLGLITAATLDVPLLDAGTGATADHDGIYFCKFEGGTTVTGRTSDETTQAEKTMGAHADGGSQTLGFKWDGVGEVEWFTGDTSFGKSTLSPTSLDPMTVFAAVKTHAAEAQVLTIDRITLIAER